MRKKVSKIVLCTSFLAASTLMLSGCDKDKSAPTKKQSHVITVEKKVTMSHLYYNGTIEPINTISTTSPVDGRVAKMNFAYGEDIKKGQQLITINADTLSDNFRSAISDYLTQKNTLSNQKITYAGSQALFKAGIIEKQTFLNDKTTYETTIMNFFQKRLALEKILKQIGMNAGQFESLSLSDTNAVNKVLSKRFQDVPVFSAGSGVALFPLPSDSNSDSSDTNGEKLIVGSEIKQGQLVLSIGDLSGYAVSFNVNEININRLKKGMKVMVTGAAFPGITLKGYISSVASQAESGQSGGNVSQFAVRVKVPKVTEKASDTIHIGMTAKVDIGIKNPAQIMVPISAVSQKNGQSVVTVLAKDGSEKNVVVSTGHTTLSDVAILSGLKSGDKVVVND